MRTKPVVALPEVESDLRQAMVHYDSWHPAGAAGFLDKYDATIGWIEWNPDSFPKKHGSVRRAIIKRTYYLVYFLQETERSLVLAVLDGRRAPGEIRGLLKARSSPARRN